MARQNAWKGNVFIMKIKLTAVILLVFIYSIPVISQDFNQQKFSTHPRILISSDDELLQKGSLDVRWNKVHSGIISDCEKIIHTPVLERKLIGRRLLDESREAFRRIFYLSYAYKTTANSKFKDKAEKEMLAISAFEDWNPSHFLDVAEMTLALAIGYDWLYNSLPTESREIIKNAIIQKGLNPSLEGKHTWLTGDSNWNQVCNTGMAFGAIAVYESNPELSEMIIKRSIQSIKLPMKAYGPDGAYPEGYTYWNYGTNFNVFFLAAIEKLFDTDFDLTKTPGFLESGTYMLHMVGPTRERFNYGDCGDAISPSPAMFWLAQKTRNTSILWNEKYFVDNIPVENYLNNRFLPAIMLWSRGLDLESMSAPGQNLWVGKGQTPVALMRSSWTDNNTVFAGLKMGKPGSSHSHMDVGSFIIEKDGVRWGLDLGIQDYNSLESLGIDLWNRKQNSGRWDIFRYNNFAHNTLIVNNQKQEVNGYASITKHSEKPKNKFAITDLSKVYHHQLTKAERGIAIINNETFIVQDEVKSLDKETVVRWNMITAADVKILSKKRIALSQEGKKLILDFDSDVKFKLKTWSTQPDNSYEASNAGTTAIGFEATIKPNAQAYFCVKMSSHASALKKVKKIEKLEDWN